MAQMQVVKSCQMQSDLYTKNSNKQTEDFYNYKVFSEKFPKPLLQWYPLMKSVKYSKFP